MPELAKEIGGLPNISGQERVIDRALAESAGERMFARKGGIDFGRVRSTAGVALHMHQPLIPAGGDDLRTAAIVSNLQYMMEHPNVGDNHNAPVFVQCYKRMGDIIPSLVHEGHRPRVMLEYSGTLLHGMRQMGLDDVFRNLRKLASLEEYRGAVEWLGAPWGHAVAPSTPVADYRLHVRAWQHHFASIFGLEALERVRGFSPSEMALPNHPDVAYEFVRTLTECGFTWVLVQEHTVEDPATGRTPGTPHIPHRLVCRNSRGESRSIVALVKTQGSDTKLVGQMQPWYEARGLSRVTLAGKSVPPLVIQIADGENGGVMMNEFPPKYMSVVRESSGTDTPLMNGTEYLEHLFDSGIRPEDLPMLQPIFQKRIWDRFEAGAGPDRLAKVIDELHRENNFFHMEGGSWTNDISWVRGYQHLLGPMERVSALFQQKACRRGVDTGEHRYRNALFHLLISQTSCFRYWGEGLWTDYGREICRRADEILTTDFD